MDPQDRDRILSLLPPMARPSDVDETEWTQLLLLEAPSILGMAMPGSEALEGSEPSIACESSETEAMACGSDDGLAGYSPSPTGVPITRNGFNLLVPGELLLECREPTTECEILALRSLRERWLWEEDLLSITEHLPSSTRTFQCPSHGDVWSCSFLTGAFVHGVSAGITNNARRYPMVTTLLTSVLQSIAPTAWFSSAGVSLNLRSAVHRDSNNSSTIPNVLIPASSFEHGELWIEDSTGNHLMAGHLGRLIPVSRPYITFDPRKRHATSNWIGNRLVLIGYHVRDADRFSSADQTELRRLGFCLYVAAR